MGCYLTMRRPWLFLAAAAVGTTPTSAGTPQAIKARKSKGAVDALRLQAGCKDCFPRNRKTCEADLWDSCCTQEIRCHDHYCREEVLGKLEPNVKVRVKDDFTSDDNDAVALTKGMRGKVLRIDGEGDAFVRFNRDEYDDKDVLRQWVFKHSAFDKLDLPASPVRMRASRVVTCLDNCTIAANCELQGMSKKQMKKFQKCAQDCKLEDCTKEDDCNNLLGAYNSCKQSISESGKCNAKEENASHAEL